jgi:hypothetical protein
MDEFTKTITILIGVGIFALVFSMSPLILSTTETKDITFIYNDAGGVFDSCGNFYKGYNMDLETNAMFNYKLKMMDNTALPVTLKVILKIPNKHIPIVSQWYSPFIEKIINDVDYSTKGECNGN